MNNNPIPSSSNRISSGFKTIDSHDGGFGPGTVFLVRTREQTGEELQDYIMTQVKNLVLDGHLRTIVLSLGMDEKEFAKCLIINQTNKQIEQLVKSPLFLLTTKKEDMIERLFEYAENEDIRAQIIVINDIGVIARPQKKKTLEASELLKRITRKATETGIPVIIADYDNVIDVGYPRDPQVTEMEIKTDIKNTVQAAIYSNVKTTIIEDLYELWSVFDAVLK